ncbi:MAG: hypothetical protein J0H29_04015 [Sphingobacteriales bacterium]|nr:hypothetical protein [Sphingobacteriales bacterium]
MLSDLSPMTIAIRFTDGYQDNKRVCYFFCIAAVIVYDLSSSRTAVYEAGMKDANHRDLKLLRI